MLPRARAIDRRGLQTSLPLGLLHLEGVVIACCLRWPHSTGSMAVRHAVLAGCAIGFFAYCEVRDRIDPPTARWEHAVVAGIARALIPISIVVVGRANHLPFDEFELGAIELYCVGWIVGIRVRGQIASVAADLIVIGGAALASAGPKSLVLAWPLVLVAHVSARGRNGRP